jgi:hypothetical protein
MDAWDAYEAAENAIKAFDARHEKKKLALIALGSRLSGGWGNVTLGNPNLARDVHRIRDDYSAIDPTDLAGDSVETIISQRSELVERLERATEALPESLRKKIGTFYDPRPRTK